MRTATNLSRRVKKLPASKKLPWKLNANGIVEKPAVPTVDGAGGGAGRSSRLRGAATARGRCARRRAPPTSIVRKSTPRALGGGVDLDHQRAHVVVGGHGLAEPRDRSA